MSGASRVSFLSPSSFESRIRSGFCSSRFRLQRETGAAPVGKRVHLLSDDVRQLADAPGEHRGFFECGCPDLAVIKEPHHGADRFLDELPAVALARENVPGALHGLKFHVSSIGRRWGVGGRKREPKRPSYISE